jgi:hypothetical protein
LGIDREAKDEWIGRTGRDDGKGQGMGRGSAVAGRVSRVTGTALYGAMAKTGFLHFG